ncbi:MAG: efflux RND transporter periplasmic adaptor subunit, partial [Pseudomonadota bacterium]
DDAYAKRASGTGTTDDVQAARSALDEAAVTVEQKRSALAAEKAKEGVPLPTRLEGGFINAFDELRVLEIQLERTRIRAPSDGTVLSLAADVGETVVPSPQRPIAQIGNLSGLTIRSEIEERDMTAVAVGQEVVVRSSAFPNRDFTGKVAWVAPTLAPPKLTGRGPRQLADVDVLELTIDMDGQPPLIPGMRVDVFFKPVAKQQANASQPSN